MKLLCLIFFVLTISKDGEWEEEVDENGRKMQKVSIKPPILTEEDNESLAVPAAFKCPMCHAVVFQLDATLKEAKRIKKTKEFDLIDQIEKKCKDGFAEGYGVSNVDGENLLQGPGIEKKEEKGAMAAVTMGGGKWPMRLSRTCTEMVEEISEIGLFKMFERSGDKLSKDMCDSDQFDHCAKENRKKAQAAKAAAKGKIKEPKVEEKKIDKKDPKITIKKFMEDEEMTAGQSYGSYSKTRTKKEWLELFDTIRQRPSNKELLEKKSHDEL